MDYICLLEAEIEPSVGNRRSRLPAGLRARRHARFVSSARSWTAGPVVWGRFSEPAEATVPKARLSDSRASSRER